jgi:hypothetical protein
MLTMISLFKTSKLYSLPNDNSKRGQPIQILIIMITKVALFHAIHILHT